MKSRNAFHGMLYGILFSLAMTSAYGQFDTDSPNQFEFASAQYFVSSGATNAVIMVHFIPGLRSWSGSVNFATQEEQSTAVPNQDYVPVTGTLNFSGTAFRTFTVPLMAGSSGLKSIRLALSPSPNDPNALLSRSNAVLNINLPPPPKLELTHGPYRTVIVSWPDDGTEPTLEKSSSGTNWEALGPVPSDGNGRRVYTDVPATGVGLYRLHRPQ